MCDIDMFDVLLFLKTFEYETSFTIFKTDYNHVTLMFYVTDNKYSLLLN